MATIKFPDINDPYWVTIYLSPKSGKTNIRSQPSLSASILTAISKEVTAKYLLPAAVGVWYPVYLIKENIQGWVHSDYIKIVPAEIHPNPNDNTLNDLKTIPLPEFNMTSQEAFILAEWFQWMSLVLQNWGHLNELDPNAPELPYQRLLDVIKILKAAAEDKNK